MRYAGWPISAYDERRLAGTVGAHDRVGLALADREVDPLEDLEVGLGGRGDPQVADDELAVVGVGHEVAPVSVAAGWASPAAAPAGTRPAPRVEGDVADRDEVREGHAVEGAR